MADRHAPVLVSEVVERLLPRPELTVLDGTVGTGGHSEALLQSANAPGRLICLDQDPDVLQVSRERLGDRDGRVHYHRGSFSDLDPVLAAEGLAGFDGILLDLGLNSWSLARAEKGLSYQVEGPLRMDLDPDLRETARDLLHGESEEGLVRIFEEFGGVRQARLFAKRIVASRRARPPETTFDLVRLLAGARPGRINEGELSRVFMALRVAVGREMERLEAFLDSAERWLLPGGRVVILTYAGHEDVRLKRFLRHHRETGTFSSLLDRPLRPTREETARNRRARSAKLYCLERGGA